MKKVLAVSAVFFASAALAVAAPSLSGKWSIHQSVAGNDSDVTCTFVQTDNAIAGSCKGEEGKELPLKGAIDGTKATWQYDSEYNGTPLTIKYTATLDDPNTIKGTLTVDPFGVDGEFTATPLKADSK